MKGYVSFYQSFYGSKFVRPFRRPSDFTLSYIQYIVKTPQQVYLHVHKNSGLHPCFASVYDYRTVDNLKPKNPDIIYLDRVYFDFDIFNPAAYELKKQLVQLRREGLNYKPSQQKEFRLQLQDLIVNYRIAEAAINEAKRFAELFKKDFGKFPALFFSGFKGCHAYCFINPVKLKDPNHTISTFAEKIKETCNLQTLDLSVNKDALSRIARVPYSKHQLTGLTVVPFQFNDSYDEIMKKSLNPVIEPFDIENYSTNFQEHLIHIDKILEHNRSVQASKRKLINMPRKFNSKVTDHRKFFNRILGPPAKEYPKENPDKGYVMYNCPFKDHPDETPSFMVNKNGYRCYSPDCNRKGNYFQFFKDYYNWSDEQVKNHLKTHLRN